VESISEQPQEAGSPPEPTPMAGPTSPAAPLRPIRAGVRRASPVGLLGFRLQLQVQHRATGLGRRSSIIFKMRRSRAPATVLGGCHDAMRVWDTVRTGATLLGELPDVSLNLKDDAPTKGSKIHSPRTAAYGYRLSKTAHLPSRVLARVRYVF
jgi:hypothetical protein